MKPRYLGLFAVCLAASCALPEFGLVDSFDGPPANAGSSNGGQGAASGAETTPGGGGHSGTTNAAGRSGDGHGGTLETGGAPTATGGNTGGDGTAGDDTGTAGMSGAGAAPTCAADTRTDRKNCGACGKVCYAPNDCGGGTCSVCANGCAVLNAPLTAAKRRSLFLATTADFFAAETLTLTAYVASGTSVVITLSAFYEEGGQVDVSKTYNTGDWATLTLKPDASKGLIAYLYVDFHENSTIKTPTTVYLESITGVPDEFGFGFVRSAGPMSAVLPVDEDPNKAEYVVGSVSWLGPP